MDKDYVVTICAYEGLDGIFGPFNREDALEITLDLKNNAPRDKYELVQEHIAELQYKGIENDPELEKKSSDIHAMIWEKWGMYYIFSPEQVCIFGTVEKGKVLACVCKDFPELPEQDVWLH